MLFRSYLPDGAELKNTVEQPEMLAYEYAINESSYFNILLSKSDTRIYRGMGYKWNIIG